MLILPANNQEERSRYTAVYISGYDEIYLSINMQLFIIQNDPIKNKKRRRIVTKKKHHTSCLYFVRDLRALIYNAL